MKLSKIFLPLVGAMVLGGCSKNEAVIPQPSVPEQTATLELMLEGEYGVKGRDEARALSFDTSYETPPFIHESGVTDWKTHCFLRKADGSAQVYALIDWTVTPSTDGSISLVMKGHTLTLQTSGSSTLVTPQPGEEWYIAGITGDGRLNSDRTQVDFRPDAMKDASLQPHQARTPLAFGWKKFKVAATSGERAPKIKVTFKPQGALLKVNVDNKTNFSGMSVSSTIKVRTNALSSDGVFDYSLSVASLTDTKPVFTFSNPVATTEVLTRDIHVGHGSMTSYLIWAYPRLESARPLSGFKTETYIGRYKTVETGTANALAPRLRGYANAIAYNSDLTVVRPWMPLEYVAEYNMKSDTEFADTHGNDASAYYTWDDAMAKFASTTIGGVAYHLPTTGEYNGVVATYNSRKNIVFNQNVGVTPDYSEPVQIEDKMTTYISDYSSKGGNISYALRFKTTDLLSAARFEYADNPLGGKMLKVTYRYLGANLKTIGDVEQESFWTTDNASDVTRIFPAAGYYYDRPSLLDFGAFGYYLTSTSNNANSFMHMIFHHEASDTSGSRLKIARETTRLFRDRL